MFSSKVNLVLYLDSSSLRLDMLVLTMLSPMLLANGWELQNSHDLTILANSVENGALLEFSLIIHHQD